LTEEDPALITPTSGSVAAVMPPPSLSGFSLTAGKKFLPASEIRLFPLHEPHNLAPIKMALTLNPELPQVACFDTAFHRNRARHRSSLCAALFDQVPLFEATGGIGRRPSSPGGTSAERKQPRHSSGRPNQAL
jgi:hypothetical protein